MLFEGLEGMQAVVKNVVWVGSEQHSLSMQIFIYFDAGMKLTTFGEMHKLYISWSNFYL